MVYVAGEAVLCVVHTVGREHAWIGRIWCLCVSLSWSTSYLYPGLRAWTREKLLRYLLCPRPDNISAPKQSEMVSVLGQFIIFCPRPENISARKQSEIVSVLGQLNIFWPRQNFFVLPSTVRCLSFVGDVCSNTIMFARVQTYHLPITQGTAWCGVRVKVFWHHQ
jgi:hypothetical protein